jgi:hypothetical protein
MALGVFLIFDNKRREIMTIRNWTKVKQTGLIVMTILIVGMGFPMPAASGESVYSYSDQSSGETVAGEKTYISGDHLVWLERDSKGNRDVFYKNIRTNESKQISDYLSVKDDPRVTVTDAGEVVVIWLDKRYVGSGGGMWDVLAQFVDSGEELKLSSTIAPHMSITASGNYVAWYETWKRDMSYYDLSQRQETQMGVGMQPHVVNGKIAFINETYDVALHTIADSKTEILVELPYHIYPTDITYNGDYILWKQRDMDRRTKYVMLDMTDPQAKPVDLTENTVKNKEFPHMFIGDGQVAWIEWNNGTHQLTGMNLNHGETYPIAQGEQVLKTLRFEDEKLVIQGADGKLVYRTIIRTEVASPGSFITAPKIGITGKLGPDGGTLSMEDGSARIVVPAGAFEQEVSVTLEPDSAIKVPVSIPHPLGTTYSASPAWNVNVEGNFTVGQSMQLVIAVDGLRWTTDQKRKMSVYKWNEKKETWLRVGGVTNPEANEVAAEINESGTYTVLMNDVSFSDVNGHWSQNNIEILAAKEIINGVAAKRFAPNESLTRAQFTKMLLGAIGAAPDAAAVSSFKDVPAGHWSIGWVEAAAELGIAQGNGDLFQPDAVLTREEMVVMLIRALGKDQEAVAFSGKLSFHDSSNVSGWAVGHTALAAELGLVQGNDGTFRPKASSTRAEAAAVIYRLMKDMGTL